MSNRGFEALVWVLVYGGLLVLCLGLFVLGQGPAWGWTLIIGGAVVAAIGAALVVVRARRGPDR